jgi:hypothetical protein
MLVCGMMVRHGEVSTAPAGEEAGLAVGRRRVFFCFDPRDVVFELFGQSGGTKQSRAGTGGSPMDSKKSTLYLANSDWRKSNVNREQCRYPK